MSDQKPDPDPLFLRLKELIADKFRFSEGMVERIDRDEPLIGGRLGLDSLDALELSMCVEDEFGITIGSAAESRAALASLTSLADFIRTRAPSRAVGRTAVTPATASSVAFRFPAGLPM